MNRALYSRLFLASSLAFLIQCSPGGFKSDGSTSSTAADNASNTPSSTTPADDAEAARRRQLAGVIAKEPMTGIFGNESDGMVVIDFDRANGVYLLRIPVPLFGSIVSYDMTFKDYPGMRLYVDIGSGKPVFTLAIPVKYVLRNVTEVPAKLPNGNPIPLFPSGEPPSKGLLLTPNKDNKVYLYLSAEAFGLYVETPFDPVPDQFPFVPMIPIKAKGSALNIGYLTTVDKIGNFKGGFFLSHRIDPKLGKILDEYYIY